MKAFRLICMALAIGSATHGPATAAPYIPQSDSEVLEQLPFSRTDPVVRELQSLSGRLKVEPDNLPLALAVARRNFDLGGVTGDPRYAGYAEAALKPWWTLEKPPEPVRLLRAALRQRIHMFDAALADLDVIVQDEPRNAQARLIRATVHQVRGEYAATRQDCVELQALTQKLVSVTCLANVDAVTGMLRDGYERLAVTLDEQRNARPELREWAITSLAEMAVRRGLTDEADSRFREALSLDKSDNYLLAAYADFLLDQGRAQEVVALLRDKTRVDPLLLRYAQALKNTGSTDFSSAVAQLRDRFEASHLRGDKVHLREEAIFNLHLLNNPRTALRLAQENWLVQKEPADLRILLEVASATGDDATLSTTRAWLAATKFEDTQIEHFFRPTLKPN